MALARHDLGSAEQAWQQLLQDSFLVEEESDPVVPYRHYYEGLLAFERGHTGEAVEHFRQALQRVSIWNVHGFNVCLANACAKLGRWSEAITEYERLLTLSPVSPPVYFGLGEAHDGAGQRERALAAYVRFLELWKDADPDLPSVRTAKQRVAALQKG